MKLSTTVRIFAATVLPALALTACNLSLAADVTPPPGYQYVPPQPTETAGPVFPLTAPDPQNGAAIYNEKCAPCHGINGLGDGPQAAGLPNQPAALASPEVARQAVPAEWFRIVTQGNLERFMPPFNSLNEQQRWDVVAYALTLSMDDAMLHQGSQVYAEVCAECHGPTGKGDGENAQAPMPDFTNQELMVGQSANVLFQIISKGAEGKMPAFGDKLSEDQRWAAAGFVRSLSFASSLTGAAAAAPTVVATELPAAAPDVTVTVAAPLTATQALTSSVLSTITGTVTDASGAPLTEGATVNLHGFTGMQLAMTATTTLNSDGTFVFDNIEIPAGRAFLATVEYGNVLYGSDVAQAETDGQPLGLFIQVYPSTKDQSGLSVDRLHFFFELVNQDTLRIAELYIISNNTGKTIVGDAPGDPVLRFTLPKGAQNLQFQDGQLGERYIETAEGFADTSPVRPGAGAYQVLYSYELPYTRKLELARPIQWNTGAVVVLAPETGLSVSGDNLQDAGSRDIQGAAYHTYNGPAMEAGSVLNMTVSGKLNLTGNLFKSSSTTDLVVGGGALGVVLVAVGLWLFQRSRKNAPVETTSVSPADESGSALPESVDAVMDAILALDDLYQDGQLPEEAYTRRRAELKARLAELKGS